MQQKLTYSEDMKKQDELWKEEKEDINIMQAFFCANNDRSQRKRFQRNNSYI